MKYLFVILTTALIIGFGVTAYFKGWIPTISITKPQAVSITNTEVSDINKDNLTVSPSPIPSEEPNKDSDQDIMDSIKFIFSEKYGSESSKFVIKIKNNSDKYASGSVNTDEGGGMWFAAKDSGEWKLLFDGNGIINCDKLVSYPDFPNTIIPQCWDTSSEKLVTR
ncbi:MAG: hypothetical protein GYA60_00945 [Candidatus Methanofastidiosa archaeon]|nr:hypothetical protein [Candidatus Methanofastidiosa archaeon]